MIEYEFSEHAVAMLKERRIHEDWVKIAIEEADAKERKDDGTLHFLKVFEEFGDRVLRVVVNSEVTPLKVVTLFFDRRLRGKI